MVVAVGAVVAHMVGAGEHVERVRPACGAHEPVACLALVQPVGPHGPVAPGALVMMVQQHGWPPDISVNNWVVPHW